MKKTIFIILMCLMSKNLFAHNSAKLAIKVQDNIKHTHYLCISGNGCINITAGSKKTLPLTAGNINYIFIANGKTYRMYPQTLPSSCNVTINNHQTLVVSGKVSKAANDNMFINQLRCSVVNG